MIFLILSFSINFVLDSITCTFTQNTFISVRQIQFVQLLEGVIKNATKIRITALPNVSSQKLIIKTRSKKRMQPQLNNSFLPTKQLHQIYPDIQGQLCSRHSTLFGKLKSTFNRLYDNMQPQYYVIVNGNCEIVQHQFTQHSLSMALQNGITILVSKTYPESQIFINSNHFSEQVIFSQCGKLKQGLNNYSEQMQTIIKECTKGLLDKQMNGGILYVHGNIPEESFQYKEVLLIGVYLSMMVVNDQLRKVSKQDIIERMVRLGFLGSREEIERRFNGYRNRMFNLGLPNAQMSNATNKNISHQEVSCERQQLVPMENEYKLLFCRLDLAQEDIRYQLARREQIKQRKKQLLKQLNQLTNINNLGQLSNNIPQIDLSEVQFKSVYCKSKQAKKISQIDCQEDEQILSNPVKFLQTLLSQIGLLKELLNKQTTIEQFINSLWQVHSQYLKLHSQDVVELVEKMKQQLNIKGCLIVNQNFLLIVVAKNRHTDLLCQVKSKMNKGELKSKSLFKIQQEEVVQQRWHGDMTIGEKMFTSVPARGIAVFDPSQAIWFQ